jgi:hypothetical protein
MSDLYRISRVLHRRHLIRIIMERITMETFKELTNELLLIIDGTLVAKWPVSGFEHATVLFAEVMEECGWPTDLQGVHTRWTTKSAKYKCIKG